MSWSIANRCSLCKRNEESIDHLFIRCEFTNNIWTHFGTRIRCNMLRSTTLHSLVSSWKSTNPILKPFANSLMHAICWYTWLERNRHIFRDDALTEKDLILQIGYSVQSWAAATRKVSDNECNVWLRTICDFRPP
ncbi:hypothetical protein LINGRAHAP2_LOCUS3540 [Linum grandiflorum]